MATSLQGVSTNRVVDAERHSYRRGGREASFICGRRRLTCAATAWRIAGAASHPAAFASASATAFCIFSPLRSLAITRPSGPMSQIDGMPSTP